jgi:hypothetical protein
VSGICSRHQYYDSKCDICCAPNKIKIPRVDLSKSRPFDEMGKSDKVTQEKCNHIIGIGEGVDEWWLCYADSTEDYKSYIEKEFDYCPLCGESLKYNGDNITNASKLGKAAGDKLKDIKINGVSIDR